MLHSVAYTYLAGVGNVSGDIFKSHWVLHSQPVTLALNASHVHQHTSIGRQPCTQNPNRARQKNSKNISCNAKEDLHIKD